MRSSSSRRSLPKKDREAIAAFYALGDFKPLWIEGRRLVAGRRAPSLARLGTRREDALDAADYPVPALGAPARHGAATSPRPS